MLKILQLIIFAIFGYLIVRIFRVFTQMVKGPKKKSKFKNPTPSNTKIDLDDVIDADFEEIQQENNHDSKDSSKS